MTLPFDVAALVRQAVELAAEERTENAEHRPVILTGPGQLAELASKAEDTLGYVPIALMTIRVIQAAREGLDHGGPLLAQ